MSATKKAKTAATAAPANALNTSMADGALSDGAKTFADLGVESRLFGAALGAIFGVLKRGPGAVCGC